MMKASGAVPVAFHYPLFISKAVSPVGRFYGDRAGFPVLHARHSFSSEEAPDA